MEPRFGHDFGHVRVHTDARAAESALAVNALAYTVGRNVVFGAGRYSPGSAGGRNLLGHELAHVVQQSGGGVSPDCRSEADAEAAATDLARGRPARVAIGTQVGLARQPSSSTDDSDLYRAFIDMPQIEKDRLLPFGAVVPDSRTTQIEDIGCHTDPNKKSPGQPKCAVSHHKTMSEAERVAAAQMQHPLDLSQLEKEKREKLDRLNEAFLYHKRTGKYIHHGEFSSYEIEKGNIIATSDRWDAWMESRGVGINNLEAAEFDRRFFRSKPEFDLELRRRNAEYKAKLATCKEEGKGVKWPKASRTRPEYLDCEERVAAEYEPEMAAAADAARAWNYRQLPTIESIETAGPVSTAGLAVGGLARVMSGGESKEAVPSALALGSLGDALALGVGAPPLPGTADDPGRAPGALVEKASPREPMPNPGPMEPLVRPEPMPTTTAVTGRPPATAPSKPAVATPTVVPDAPPKTTTPKIVPAPKPKATPKATVSPKEKALTPKPSGEQRGTILGRLRGYQTTKESQPEVIVRRTTGRTPDPAASFDPYQPSKTNVAGEYGFRQFEKGGKIYQQAEGRLGMPDEVQTHRDVTAQRNVSRGTGDDAGHLIGNRFGPPGSAENLGRQNWVANRVGNYHALEDAWAGLRRQGVQIDVQVTDVTRIGEDRPFMRNVQWTETAPDGSVKNYEVDFANTTTPESRFKSGNTPTSGGGKVIKGDFGKQ
jgi:hypothetical protein